ncbi:PAS domain-containing sensor histidine kinase [Haloglomus litoreum]|uniref:PAS domain-containing sensor histidine kinase n=1 Tax=Haloglomus litoreum TaxID=3034026 RepID=UPI0023E8B971|nr:PAS domain-containing sensor histidine kinase [Haloglomus sp. DT116]
MSQSILSGVVDDLDTAVIVHDPETGAVLDANPAVENLYGYRPEELTQLSVEEFSSESDQYTQERAERAIAATADGDEQEFEWQIKTSCGELRWANVRLHSVTVDGEEYVLAELDDITESKTRSRRLRLLYRLIRHNLRNDMTVIIGHADSLQQEVTDEQYRERLTTIKETAAEVGEMTDSVRDIFQIASSEESDATPTNVPDLLEDIIDEVEANYPEATVRLSVATPAVIAADGGLRAALYNAVENAVEHSRQAAPVVEVRIDTTTADRTVTVEVVDHGPTIPQMELDALDLHSQGTGTEHGTGVGLFVMKWCTESLGGDLDVRSAETGGNLVEFTFPMYEGDPEAGAQATV